MYASSEAIITLGLDMLFGGQNEGGICGEVRAIPQLQTIKIVPTSDTGQSPIIAIIRLLFLWDVPIATRPDLDSDLVMCQFSRPRLPIHESEESAFSFSLFWS